MQIDTGNGRQQKVYAGLNWGALQVTSPFVWASRIDAERVLAANTAMFGIVEISGAYALKHNAFVDIGLVTSGDYAYIAAEEIGFIAILALISLGLGVGASRKKQNLGTPALIVSIIATVMMFAAAAYGL